MSRETAISQTYKVDHNGLAVKEAGRRCFTSLGGEGGAEERLEGCEC